MARNKDIALTLATSLDDLSCVTLSPEEVFGRHCAIVGSSGSGKSWSVTRLIEECAKHRSNIVLLDATGEYEPLAGGTFHIHLGEARRSDCSSLQATIPYYELSEADLFSIFQPSSATQWMKLRAAIKTLRLLQLQPGLGSHGTFIKAQKNKSSYDQSMSRRSTELERPDSIFNIHRLPLQIELECVDPIRSQSELDCWGGVNREDLSECLPLINRVEDTIKAPELAGIFHPPEGPSAFEALEKLITDHAVSVLRISMEFLPSTNRVREIIANALARHLLSLGRAGILRGRPVVLVIDEAHQILRANADQFAHRPLEAFQVIAKEGRKYGLTLCVATQRPRDIPEDILSQIGTFIAHRLIASTDRSAIEHASGAMDDSHLACLATLGPGEALLLGAGMRDPKRVKLLAPSCPPRSLGPDYQKTWRRVTSPSD
jgi:hypothetical protein